MISSGSDYMENLKSYYDKNTIKKILNDKKVLGIQSYDHYVNAFVKNYKGGVIEDDAIKSIQTKVNAIEDNWIETALDDIFLMFETETPAEENEGVAPPARPAPAEEEAKRKAQQAEEAQPELRPRPPTEEERSQSEEAARRTAEEESLKKTKEEEEKRDAARKVAEEEEAKRRAQILKSGPPVPQPKVPPPTNEMKKDLEATKKAEAEAKAEQKFKEKPEYIFNEKIMKEFQKYKHLFEEDIEFQRMTQ